MAYFDRLNAAAEKNRSLVCLGLDPDPARLPVSLQGAHNPQLEFNRAIVEATKDYVCAFKPNIAFYEAQRIRGLTAFLQTVEAIPDEIPIICDAKRGDIGSTAEQYAKAIFERLGCDAVTVNPYLGGDTLEPFLKYEEKGIYVLCLTSNPGASDFQIPNDLYLRVAEKAREWNTRGNCGLVAGATHPERMASIRAAAPELPFLVPGVGAQGGSIEAVAKAASIAGAPVTAPGFVINASRSIIYASSGEDFAEAAAREAKRMRDEINAALERVNA